MKRIIAIVFLFIFLSANTAFGQLYKLPVLIHHYLEHVDWDNNSSFIDFLSKHYVAEIKHPDDKHHDHQKLPFKSIGCHTIHVVATVSQPHSSFSQIILLGVELKKSIRNQQHYSSAHLNSIWQPPRFS